jgi:hypothetical protein
MDLPAGDALMFDLKRPCKNCPFRKGVGETFQLSMARLKEIKHAIAFQCHHTVDYEHFDDPEKRSGDRPQQCAGLMAVLQRDKATNSIMQVAERIGGIDFSDLDPDGEAYASWEDVIAAHGAVR